MLQSPNAQSLPLGSETWTNGASHTQDPLFAACIAYVTDNIAEQALLVRAEELRPRVSCCLGEVFTVGTVNYVRKVSFSDGVEWILRLRMPEFEDKGGGRFGPKRKPLDAYALESEIHTMEYLRTLLDVIIPRVHYYNFDADEIGFPFVIMDYIHGSTASEVAAANCAERGDIPEEYAYHFWSQVAHTMGQLASCSFSKIGSITRTEDGSYNIGRFVDPACGPYRNVQDFYHEFPQKVSQTLYEEPDYLGMPSRFKELVLGSDLRRGTEQSGIYGLTNLDLGPHNMLVDHDFNIVGMIDLDCVVSLPISLCHQLPLFANMALTLPGPLNNLPITLSDAANARAFARLVGIICHGTGLMSEGFYGHEVLAWAMLMLMKDKKLWTY